MAGAPINPETWQAIEETIAHRQPPGSRPRRSRDEVWFLCPAHDDHHPSARWNRQKHTWYCDACGNGGGAEDLVTRLSITPRESRAVRPARERKQPEASRKTVTAYPYLNAVGDLLYEVVRYEPKQFRQRRPDGQGGWIRNLDGVQRVLYQLPSLLTADEDAIVFVPEGERDVDALRSRGLVATTNSGGAGQWRSEYAGHLARRRVVILPDNDDPGEEHAADIYQSLAGTARTVVILRLPGLAVKGDVREWFQAGGTAADLLSLAEDALRTTPLDADAETALQTEANPAENRGRTPRLADAIMTADDFAIDAGKRLYVFERGVYRPGGDAHVAKRIKALLNEWGESQSWTTYRVREVVAYIATDAPRLSERPPGDDVNLLNGILNVVSGNLRPHSPDFLSPVQLPIAFDAAARCPAWEQQVQETLPADAKDSVWELLACLLTPDTSIQKAVLFLGDGANGKSTLLRAITAFIGRGNVSALSLHRIETDRFAAGRLVGKLANICPDLPSERLSTTSVFKAITGGDSIVAEHKYQDSFDLTLYCKLIFSTNHLPRSEDGSPAFFRRWRVIPFDSSFEGATARPSGELDARLSDPNELAGALNRALAVLAGLRARGDFTDAPSMRAAWNAFRSQTDPIAGWLDRHTITDSTAREPRNALYAAYQAECAQVDRPASSQKAFAAAVRRLRPNVRDGRRMVAERYVWCWLGLGLKADAAERHDLSTASTMSTKSSICSEAVQEGSSEGREQGAGRIGDSVDMDDIPDVAADSTEIPPGRTPDSADANTIDTAGITRPDSQDDVCADCGNPMEAGEKCWHCGYMLCRDCGARTQSALVIYCPACRSRPEPPAGG